MLHLGLLLEIARQRRPQPTATAKPAAAGRLPYPDPPLKVRPAPLSKNEVDEALAEMLDGWDVVESDVPEEPGKRRVELHREFEFDSFGAVPDFMQRARPFIDEMNHHPRFGTQMLNEAKAQGFTPANFSIMPFDGGFSGGGSQVAALEAFHTLLMSTFGWSSATAYAHEGISQMNGRSDAAEYFRQADFQTTLDYATSHRIARYTFWSVNRDRQCPDPNQSTTSGTCSSVPQAPWEFTKYTARFAGATPPTTVPTTTPATTPPGGGCTVAAWSATAVYTQGNQVSQNGHTYTAKWWTQNESPATHSGQWDVWIDNGPC